MRDRVRELNGKFEIYSEKDEGFEISITIPLKKVLAEVSYG
jgi:Signal transduction histidine kinase